MQNLETILKHYEINLEFFDLKTFLDEIMDIPYQIELLDKNYHLLTNDQQLKFKKLNKKLADMLKNVKVDNEIEKRVISYLINILEKEKQKKYIA